MDAVGREDRDTDTQSDLDLVPVDLEIAAECFDQAIAELPGRRFRRLVGNDQHEFVTADARDERVIGRRLQAAGGLAQKAVAYQMAIDVVGFFEVVEVEAHDGELLAGLCSLIQRLVEMLEERRAIWQSGQGVVVGKIRNVLLGPALLGDVVENGEQIFRFAALVPDCDLACLDQALPVAERVDDDVRASRRPGRSATLHYRTARSCRRAARGIFRARFFRSGGYGCRP